MTDRKQAHTGLGGLKAHILVLMGLWTILVGGVLAWTLFRHVAERLESARFEALPLVHTLGLLRRIS